MSEFDATIPPPPTTPDVPTPAADPDRIHILIHAEAFHHCAMSSDYGVWETPANYGSVIKPALESEKKPRVIFIFMVPKTNQIIGHGFLISNPFDRSQLPEFQRSCLPPKWGESLVRVAWVRVGLVHVKTTPVSAGDGTNACNAIENALPFTLLKPAVGDALIGAIEEAAQRNLPREHRGAPLGGLPEHQRTRNREPYQEGPRRYQPRSDEPRMGMNNNNMHMQPQMQQSPQQYQQQVYAAPMQQAAIMPQQQATAYPTAATPPDVSQFPDYQSYANYMQQWAVYQQQMAAYQQQQQMMAASQQQQQHQQQPQQQQQQQPRASGWEGMPQQQAMPHTMAPQVAPQHLQQQPVIMQTAPGMYMQQQPQQQHPGMYAAPPQGYPPAPRDGGW